MDRFEAAARGAYIRFRSAGGKLIIVNAFEHVTWKKRYINAPLYFTSTLTNKLNLVYLQGQADPLNSAFHLTYNMVLNLLRVEEVNPEIMLERSFYQFQNYAAIPNMVDSESLRCYCYFHCLCILKYM